MAFDAPYVSRRYGGITLPLYFAAGLLVFVACNVRAGSIWRAGHAEVRREDSPGFFWVSNAIIALVGIVLLVIGFSNWLALRHP